MTFSAWWHFLFAEKVIRCHVSLIGYMRHRVPINAMDQIFCNRMFLPLDPTATRLLVKLDVVRLLPI